ncbi:glucosamine-6-phosphate deaminase [Paeniglutamicibacter cryotolerans]|uniref:Glucosamine-6-phosphate deaminase n=1 Tax=Paeniglutamicibacter cryotolerans TaxID=670079 RepID=A0A839QMQ4_9MICC|nr:glucosamine-6-phosphate deaminase [Paeniglutamicibacter cryotolerans]MBB2996044.1 glucosamine-6-phosphate deaminase [Paeniglutamicibacter cryotolerans]
MEVLIAQDPAEAAKRAADAVLDGLRRVDGHRLVLGLATGSSPLGLYAELAAAVARGDVDFSETLGFALDEYIGIAPDREQSYRQTLLNDVCKVIGLPEANLNVPDGMGAARAEIAAAAAAYDAKIAAVGGIDVQILGIGTNGHVGFNEPGSSLASRTRIMRLANQTREDNARFFAGIGHVPTHCVTQGLGTLREARRLVLIATGAAKAEAVAAAIEGPLTASCPASVLQLHPDVVICLDEAAASGLRNREYYDASALGFQVTV